jgi:ABC-2 type transport system ATP-binding protein
MLLAIEHLSHSYNGKAALNNLNLHLNSREILGLLGPNGSGKSTLLKILSTLLKPQQGRAEVCGFDVAKHPDAVRARIGVVFQTQTLDKMLTVEENLLACGTFYGLFGRGLHERVREVLAQLSLSDRRHDLAGALSGGLQRRAEIARALLHAPQLLLLDEPSTGLDPAARQEFWRALESLRAQNNTAILLSTHLFEEAERCDNLVLLDRGERVAEGSPEDLKASIGGQVITLRARDNARAAKVLTENFAYQPLLEDGALRFEVDQAHLAIPRIADALPNELLSIGFHQPTLEDVFLRATGKLSPSLTIGASA